MNQVRVFILVHPVSREVNLLVFLIHVLHLAHIPFPLRNLMRGASRGTVVHVQVVVIIPFARPDDTFAVCQKMAENARIVYIFLFFLFDERAHAAILGRDFEYAVNLMSAFVIFESNSLAVAVPLQRIDFILMTE